jgi:SulP family sulfate permease
LLVKKDLVAGVTVAIVALPLALGFGITSGMSPAAGLTTAIIAGFLAALFGGSKYQVSGPTGAMTVVLIPIISKYGVQAVPLLGLIAGLMVISMGGLKFGNLINKTPWAVVEGFTVGIAVIISLQQVPLVLAQVKGDGDKPISIAIATFKEALQNGLNWMSILVVVVTLTVKFGYPSFAKLAGIKPHIPASFVAITFVTIAVQLFTIDVPSIGEVPRNIGSWKGSELAVADISKLLWPAFLIALLCAIESLLAARVADGMVHAQGDQRFQPNRELVGQGIGTVAASLFGGMPATGAIARTGVNVRSHAQSKYAAMFHAVVLVAIALVFAPIVSAIPSAAIAGVLLGTSYRILNPVSILESLRTTKSEVTVLVVSAVVTVGVDLIWGIVVGTVLHYVLERFK